MFWGIYRTEELTTPACNMPFNGMLQCLLWLSAAMHTCSAATHKAADNKGTSAW